MRDPETGKRISRANPPDQWVIEEVPELRIVSEDVPGEQLNIDARKWKIAVPANGERIVRVVYETRY